MKLLDDEELTETRAERWIAAALAEAKALREYDGSLFPTDDDPAHMATSHRLHDAWHDWIDRAQRLLGRLPVSSRQKPLGYWDLDHAIRLARAITRRSPEEMLARFKSCEAGEGIQANSIEELRRELGLPLRK